MFDSATTTITAPDFGQCKRCGVFMYGNSTTAGFEPVPHVCNPPETPTTGYRYVVGKETP